ncbi:MAG TPA: restriction endonuclease [Thermoanaerobaculia bacterium]|nr:restriction endonuclease [Thermoanaerobaculia bacterium]
MFEHDPVSDLRQRFVDNLSRGESPTKLRIDEAIDSSIAWRPHVFDETSGIAWHILAEAIESDYWVTRMKNARISRPGLRVGVVVSRDLLTDDETLVALNDLGCQVAVLHEKKRGGTSLRFFASAADTIYEDRVALSPFALEKILDRLLDRCTSAKTKNAKGVSLEVLAAVLMSQIIGFEVSSVGVSNRSQQVDVVIHNRIASGALGRSDIVIVEAKNWKSRVGVPEYAAFYRKIETRRGTCRLGFFITTDRFTRGIATESQHDSKDPYLVVTIDGSQMPKLWRELDETPELTRRLEDLVLKAAMK